MIKYPNCNKMVMIKEAGALFIFSLVTSVYSLDNGLALTPPMGWLSWERFLCDTDCNEDPDNCISEKLYMDMADRMAEDGFKDVGYEYINIDDCWMAKDRDAQGRLQADPNRFPHGIKALADYVHSKGLKLGIYEDCGTLTCAGYPGSQGHYEIDAQTFADWGVDMLKLDGCYASPNDMDVLYPQMTAALNKTGRPILFSCSWPDYQRGAGMKPDYAKIAKNCNMWRNYDDISDSWSSVLSILDYYSQQQDVLVPAAGPGHWNDPDMILLGNFGLSYDESKAQLALWTVLAAPLLMSNDLRNLAPEFKALLTNKDVIAVNQDKLGMMGKRVYNNQSVEIWKRPITPVAGSSDYSYAVVAFNRRNMGSPVKVTIQLSSLGLTYQNGYDIHELFENRYMGFYKPVSSVTVNVDPSGVVMFVAKVRQ